VQVVLSAALISLVQLLFFGFCGLGLARLLLPARLRAHELTLAPFFGLALLALLGFYGAHLGLTMRQILPIALGLAALLAIFAFRRTATWRINHLPARELAALLAVFACAWLVNLAPVLNYGALVPPGTNWDIEFYLPLAEYLKDYSYLNLAAAPANPLRLVVLAEPTISRAMGATYAQSMSDLIGGWDSWDSWVPMLALLRALALLGLYALLREGLGVRVLGALAGAALVAINGLLLWTTYNSFGMGLGGSALLPAALVCLLATLEDRSAPAILGAGLLLSGLTCTYWPLLMAYAVGAGGMGLALLWERRRGDWPAVLGRGLLVLVVGGALGLLAHLHAPSAFLASFAEQVPSMGIRRFISPATIAGSAPMPWDGDMASAPLATGLAWAGLAASLALGALGIWYGSARRGLALGIAAGSASYLLALQFVGRFPYGFMRGASYINALPLGIVGAGLLARRVSERMPKHVPWMSATLALLLLCASASASYRTYAVFAPRPALFGVESAGLRSDLARLNQPGPVSISPLAAIALCDTAFTPWAYALRQHEIVGVVGTGYALLRNPRPGIAPTYMVLAQSEDPGEYGLQAVQPIWQNHLVAVYAAPRERVAWLNGRAGSDGEPPLCGRDTTALNRAKFGLGDYATALPEAPLKLYTSAEALGWVPLAGNAARRDLVLALASFTPQSAEIGLGAEHRRIELPAGLSTYRAGAIDVPSALTIRPTSSPIALRWASLESAGAPAEPALPDQHTLLLGLRSIPRTNGAQVQLLAQNSGPQLLRYAVEIYEDRAGYRDTPAHYAWTLFPAPQSGVHQLDLDLAAPQIGLDGQALPIATDAIRDGAYFAALWVYQGEQVRARLPFLRFERHGSQITAIAPLNLNTAFVPLAEPRQPADTQFGKVVGLRSFELDTTQVQPGGRLQASLLWRAEQEQTGQYLVFVQLLDDANRKAAQWDGALGGEWWPTLGWRPGQAIWQDIPLQVAADAPPGRYRLIAGVYDPATGARLRQPDGSDSVLLGQVDIQAPAP
jgi:hypothetical protein